MNDYVNRRSSGSQLGVFASGLALGGIIGAGVALLLAPRSGEEVRSMIGDRSNDIMSQLGSKVSDVRDAAQQQVDSARQQLDEKRQALSH